MPKKKKKKTGKKNPTSESGTGSGTTPGGQSGTTDTSDTKGTTDQKTGDDDNGDSTTKGDNDKHGSGSEHGSSGDGSSNGPSGSSYKPSESDEDTKNEIGILPSTCIVRCFTDTAYSEHILPIAALKFYNDHCHDLTDAQLEEIKKTINDKKNLINTPHIVNALVRIILAVLFPPPNTHDAHRKKTAQPER